MIAIERFLLVNVPTVWLGVGSVGIAVILALGGFLVVRRLAEHTRLVRQHDVAGFLIAVVGVIYAVLLAFMVVIQWENYSAARQDASTEAKAIGGIYRDSVALGPAGNHLRVAVTKYANAVATVEWPYMATHLSEDPRVDPYRNAMWKAVTGLRVTNPTAQEIVKDAIANVSRAGDARRTRVDDSSSELSPVMWAVLIAGGILTVGFCYFFSLESFASQAAMISILATLITLSLFLILTLDLPFTGTVATHPTALTDEIHEFCSYNFVHPLATAAGCTHG